MSRLAEASLRTAGCSLVSSPLLTGCIEDALLKRSRGLREAIKSPKELRQRDRKTALAVALVLGLLGLSWALESKSGVTRYAKVRQLTLEFTRMVEQIEKPSAWGF